DLDLVLLRRGRAAVPPGSRGRGSYVAGPGRTGVDRPGRAVPDAGCRLCPGGGGPGCRDRPGRSGGRDRGSGQRQLGERGPNRGPWPRAVTLGPHRSLTGGVSRAAENCSPENGTRYSPAVDASGPRDDASAPDLEFQKAMVVRDFRMPVEDLMRPHAR